jgi:RNA polymerase primary sigma factor
MEELSHYNKIIEENPLLTADEEKYLATCIINGRRNKQKARERLFNSNLRLVISSASRKHKNNANIPILDLISSGYIGLMRAVDRFDPNKFETRFSTYATPWIALYINRAVVEFNSHIHIPSNVLAQRKKYNQKSLEEGADSEEIKESLNISEKQMKQIEAANTTIVSLQAEASKSGSKDTTIGDMIEDIETKGVVKSVCESEEIRLIRLYLDNMDDLRKDIIESRHLKVDKETLDSVGERYNLSKERIRQLEKSALDELKSFIKKKTKFNG